jgi:hypothetical protein
VIPADFQHADSFSSPVTCGEKSTKMQQKALKSPEKTGTKEYLYRHEQTMMK